MRGALALARVAAAEAVRSRALVGVALLLVAALAVVAAAASGDGTIVGRARATLSAALDVSQLLVLVAAAFMASTSLASELEDGRIIPFAAAPVTRAAILAGKWLGLTAILGVLLAVALAASGLVVRAIASRAEGDQRARLDEEVLTARIAIVPDPLDPRPAARARFEKLLAEGRLPQTLAREDALKRLELFERMRASSVRRGGKLEWSLGPVPATKARSAALRFKYDAIAESGALAPGQGPRGSFVIDGAARYDLSSAPGVKHEIALPSQFVAGKAVTRIAYQNRDDRPIVVIFPPEGIELLVPSHGFGLNLVLALAVYVARVSFVIALGLALATVLDGKVATLVTLFILAVAAAHGFLDEAIGPEVFARSNLDRHFGAADPLVKLVLRGVLEAIPDLGRGDPSRALESGLVVPEVVSSVVGLGLVRGGAVLGLGVLALSRRELGDRGGAA